MIGIKADPLISTLESKTVSPVFSTDEFNKVLEEYRELIVTTVQKQVPHHLVSPEGVDDLIQATLITFWGRLTSENVQIIAPKAYISSIVHSRSIDMLRQRQRQKLVQSLSIDQDDEEYQNDPLLTLSDERQDPALEYEYKELIGEIVEAALELPPCQRRAMICLLKDEVQDISLLAEAFGRYGIDIAAINWPQDPVALQSLRSSLSIARRKFRLLRATSTENL